MGGFCHRDDSDWTADFRDNLEKVVPETVNTSRVLNEENR
jgi:hypothetical protein